MPKSCITFVQCKRLLEASWVSLGVTLMYLPHPYPFSFPIFAPLEMTLETTTSGLDGNITSTFLGALVRRQLWRINERFLGGFRRFIGGKNSKIGAGDGCEVLCIHAYTVTRTNSPRPNHTVPPNARSIPTLLSSMAFINKIIVALVLGLGALVFGGDAATTTCEDCSYFQVCMHMRRNSDAL